MLTRELYEQVKHFNKLLRQHHTRTVQLFLRADDVKSKLEECLFMTDAQNEHYEVFLKLYKALGNGAIKNLTETFEKELAENEENNQS